jgi:uncharacterized RDD family membrane protein YckC
VTELIGYGGKGRLFAMMVDNLLAMICAMVAGRMLPSSLSNVAHWVAASIVYLLYFFVQEAAWSRSLGKFLFGLSVVDLQGKRIGWAPAFWRTILRVLEVNPIVLGAIPGAIILARSKRRQRLGDMIGKTVVVHKSDLLDLEEAERA